MNFFAVPFLTCMNFYSHKLHPKVVIICWLKEKGLTYLVKNITYEFSIIYARR
jgi:hypothetical protein